MRFRSLDENWDFKFGKGRNDYVRDNNAIALNIKTRILSWYKDCFFAMNEGIDWYNRIGDKTQRELLEQDVKRVIIQTEGVTELVTFSTDLTARNFTASYTVRTVYTGTVNGSIERTF